MSGPLHNVRVLDFTTSVMGPYAAQLLGDMGADVIKIEAPRGDGTRSIGSQRNPLMTSFFLGFNRNKRSIVLDMKQPSGREAFLQLAATADVLLVNLRPKAAARLGVNYETFAEINPRLIYLAAYGYRAGGPYADNAAYDDVIQAGCGFAYLQGSQGGEPHYVPSIVADKTSGLMIVNSVLAALYARDRTGVGQSIEVPMFESMVAYVVSEHLEGETFVPPAGTMGYKRIMTAERRPFATKDGHISVLPYTDDNWTQFATVAGYEHLLDDPTMQTQRDRFANIDAFYRLVADIVAGRTTAEWLELLAKTNIPYGPMNTLEGLLDDPQLAATGFWTVREHPTEGRLRFPDFPIRFSQTPAEFRLMQPALGQHSVSILEEVGVDRGTIDTMLASGATIQSDASAARSDAVAATG